jgi:hypothetical protein
VSIANRGPIVPYQTKSFHQLTTLNGSFFFVFDYS